MSCDPKPHFATSFMTLRPICDAIFVTAHIHLRHGFDYKIERPRYFEVPLHHVGIMARGNRSN